MPARRAATTGLRPVTISGPSGAERRCGPSEAVEESPRRGPVVSVPVRVADLVARAVWRLPYQCRSSALRVRLYTFLRRLAIHVLRECPGRRLARSQDYAE